MKCSTLFLSAALVAYTSAFLFPGAGGGGGGCGCGCEDTSCIPRPPKLGCQRISFSIPTIKFPAPCPCGCGRKKRDVEGQDAKCNDPELRKIILSGVRNSPTESRENIVTSLKEKFGKTRFLVTCIQGEYAFQSSAEKFCADGTPQQTCHVVRAVDQNN